MRIPGTSMTVSSNRLISALLTIAILWAGNVGVGHWHLTHTLCACGIRWTSGPEDGATLYACADRTLLLGWMFTETEGVEVSTIQWKNNYDDRIAIYTLGIFVPLFDRVHQVLNRPGSLVISNMTAPDSGNYSIYVTTVDQDGYQDYYSRSVVVIVADGLLTRDGSLHVTQSAAAVLDADDHWALELTCGHFIFQDNPLADVHWLNPSGQLMSSTNYTDGHFALHLTTPITYGRYTCRVRSQSPNSCAHDDSEASVSVDVTAARLSLLEASLVNTQARLDHTETQLSDTKTQLSDTQSRLSQAEGELASTATLLSSTHSRLVHSETQLSDTQTRLSNTLTLLYQRFVSLENRTSKTVSFHSRFLTTPQQHSGSLIIVRDVITNVGKGYNNRTGIFTAPISGVYFVVGATGPMEGGHLAGMRLMVDDHHIAVSRAYDQHGGEQTSSHGVVHLTAGQTVWLMALETANYRPDVTTFSGFLVTPDP